MKIIRCRDAAGSICHAALQSDGTARRLEGDLYTGLSLTEEDIAPGPLLAPLEPEVIYCIGLNHHKHAQETHSPIPEWPVVFMKAKTSIQHPLEGIKIPKFLPSKEVDYEGELAVIIGRTCKNILPSEAFDYVLGYCCANDVSARDWQRARAGNQWCRAKSFDTFCPLGPCIVTQDEIPDPSKLITRTFLNGEMMQDWPCADMIFSIPELIAFLAGSTTLVPGTVILTGTPHGVGAARNPPIYLKSGDLITIAIPGIGELSNPIIDEF